MTRYSNEPKDQIFVKCYGFLSFAKIWAKLFARIQGKA